MEVYQTERLIIERNNMFAELQRYVETEAIEHRAHVIEENLFRRLLELGKIILQEVFARFGTGKLGNHVVNVAGVSLPSHKTSTIKYQSIFGVIRISRACYWKKGYASVCPLDAHFNLPERTYSHLLVKWVQDGVTEEPYEEGLQRIENILGISLCKRSQEILSHEVAMDVEQFYKDQSPSEYNDDGSIIVGTTDCKGVVMVPKERSEQTQHKADHEVKARDCRGRKGLKRDAVVTSDYSINPAQRTPDEVLELLMRSLSKDQRKERKAKGKAFEGRA